MPGASCYKLEDEGGTGTETVLLDIFKDMMAKKQKDNVQLISDLCVLCCMKGLFLSNQDL